MRITLRLLSILLLLASASGCTRSKADAPRSQAPPVALKETPPPEPKAVRQGLNASLLWRQPNAKGGMCSHEFAALHVTEMRADSSKLYIDVHHSSPGTFDSFKAEPVDVVARIDGCLTKTKPVAEGRVWRDWASPASASIPLEALPDGEIELVLRAFGREATVPMLRKDGRTIRQIHRRESARYVYFPADPKRGLDAAGAMIEPDCAQENTEDEP